MITMWSMNEIATLYTGKTTANGKWKLNNANNNLTTRLKYLIINIILNLGNRNNYKYTDK